MAVRIILSKSQWEFIGRIAGWKEGFVKITPSDLPAYIDNGEFYGLITPNGDFYECGKFGHVDLIAEMENRNPNELFNHMDVFYEFGYIRVAINSKFSNYVEFEGDVRKHLELAVQIQQQYSDWLLNNMVEKA